MATVRMTGSLVDQIKNNATNLFSNRVREACAHVPEMVDADLIFDRFLDADPQRRSVLHDVALQGWAVKSDMLRVQWQEHSKLDLRFKSPRDVLLQWTNKDYSFQGLRLYKPKYRGAFQDLFQKEAERQERIKAVNTERDAFVRQVQEVIGRVSTLKQALALWPGLWELVPQDAKNAHNEVTARTKAEPKELPTIDVESLNTAVVVSKIVEGVI